MIKQIILVIALGCFAKLGFAQIELLIPTYLNTLVPEHDKVFLFDAIDSVLADIEAGEMNDLSLSESTRNLLKSSYDWFLTYWFAQDSKNGINLSKHLTNIYEIEPNIYSVSIVYLQNNDDTCSLRYSLRLIANMTNNEVVFSLPLLYETGFWKKSIVGNITYFHRDSLNQERARLFDVRNTLMAEKFNLTADSLDFYMCRNYQEILYLLGIEYSIHENGKIRDGYGVDDKTIFSIQNNEDFSHDIFHYYSGKVNKQEDRNWIAEEGLAYLWGNAYYTDAANEMISLDKLVSELKEYLKENKDVAVYTLFVNDTKIFDHLAPEVSVRSVVSGIIAKEIYRKYGMEGTLLLINCGSKERMKSYLKTVNKLLRINEKNFSSEMPKLMMHF